MKKRRFLILLAAILSITMILAACEETSDGTGSSTSAASSETDSGTQSGSSQESASESGTGGDAEESSTEGVLDDHEIRDYFVFEDWQITDDDIYSTVSRIDGEVIDYDWDNNLLAVKTLDLDNFNNVVETIKVYDLTTMEVINEQTVTNEYNADVKDTVRLSVELAYPVIRVERASYSEGSINGTVYDVSYYFAKKDGGLIAHTNKENFDISYFDNGLVAVDMGDTTFWIDAGMNIVRTVDSIAANGYDIDEFNCEYKGYLYAWDYESLQIFNRSGMCCATYNIAHDGEINVHVLDNGNVLIQDLEYVDQYTRCDFVLEDCRIVVKSYVMNFINGELNEVDLNFIVDRISTAYEEAQREYSHLPFDLADGHDNQVFIFRFANGTIARYPEYAVMTNDLEIEYSLKNETEGVDMYSAYMIDANHYCADIYTAGYRQTYLFDLDGNIITIFNDDNMYVFGDKIVDRNGVYDMKMNVLYDFDAEGYSFYGYLGGDMLLGKFNFEKNAYETYKFNVAKLTPELLADGVNVEMGYHVTYNIYVLYDYRTDECIFYNLNGEEILRTGYHYFDVETVRDAAVIQIEFEGNSVLYVISK